jgi:hypothetical protein
MTATDAARNAGRSGGVPTLISYMDMAIGAITL